MSMTVLIHALVKTGLRRIISIGRHSYISWYLLVATILAITPTHLLAQKPPEPRSVSVGLYASPPFVMPADGKVPSGMAVDLWRLLAERENFASSYRYYPTFHDLVEAAHRGEVDVAVTNLTITRERAEKVDFTHPWYDAGMRIMTAQQSGSGFRAVIAGLESAGHLRAFGWLLAAIIAGTILLTLFDRRFDKEFPDRWTDGVAESFYSVMSVATSGRAPLRRNIFGWRGRFFAALWLACGIGVVAYFTSSITSVMTTMAITGSINGPGDLAGRRIGVLSGSVAEKFALESRLNQRGFSDLNSAADALADRRIDAFIGDAPVLEYYVHANPGRNLTVVGKIFEPDKYGFASKLDSGFTKDLTIELLGLEEQGTLDNLRTQYFGDAL